MTKEQMREAIEKIIRKYRFPDDMANAIVERLGLDKEKMRYAGAQGWCTERNSKKIMDADLLLDIVDAICKADVLKVRE